MATAPTTSRKPKHPNFVHNDEIWKDHVRHELQAWRKWPDKWGFLTQEYNRMNRNLIGISTPPIITTPETSIRVRPKSGKSRSGSPRPGSTSSVKLPVIDKGSSASMAGPQSKTSSSINFPNIKPRLSTTKFVSKFPVTTAGEIGSRSTKTEYQLELYGRYAPNARGQHGILNLMKWPQQGL